MSETKAPKQAAYNKNDKIKDIRSTNIQAAKGKFWITQQLQTVSELVWVPEAWIK